MSLAGMSVLLAEDNPTNQMVAMHMLESLGAEVTIANDGAEALEVLDRHSFDVALIDIEMPRLSGLDLIRELRSRRTPISAMPMIALTAYVMREHRAAIEEAGADGIIAKPIVSIGEFGKEIRAHMRHRDGKAPELAAGAPCAAGRAPDFDTAMFDRLRASFDKDARGEFVSCIKNDIVRACESVAAAVRSCDFDRLRTATHPLVAIAGMIGAVRLQSLAQRLNSAGHAQDDNSLHEHGSELLLEAERVLRTVCG